MMHGWRNGVVGHMWKAPDADTLAVSDVHVLEAFKTGTLPSRSRQTYPILLVLSRYSRRLITMHVTCFSSPRNFAVTETDF